EALDEREHREPRLGLRLEPAPVEKLCWTKTLIQARPRRRPSVLPSSRVRTHLRLSRGNGSTTSAIDWRLDTVPSSSPVSKQIFSRRSGRGLLPTFVRLNCWMHLGKLRSVG